MAISEIEYDTCVTPIAQLAKQANYATLAVAFSNFWNRDEVIDTLGDEVGAFIEGLFEDVGDQYSTMARFEAGEFWDEFTLVGSDASATDIASAIIEIFDAEGAEDDRYIAGQDKAVALVREFVKNA